MMVTTSYTYQTQRKSAMNLNYNPQCVLRNYAASLLDTLKCTWILHTVVPFAHTVNPAILHY
jgi:hypothetical protein